MTKLFLDTNIWLRYFLRDEEEQYQEVVALFSKIEEGSYRVYTSSVVLLELFFVLRKTYSFTHDDIDDVFMNIQQVRAITILETTDFTQALKWYRKYRVKLADCIIASTLSADTILVSYDKDFERIDDISVQQPHKLI